jgi:hypothetical protein
MLRGLYVKDICERVGEVGGISDEKKWLPSHDVTGRHPEKIYMKMIAFHIKKGFYRLLSLVLFCKCHEILDFVLHNLLSQRYIKKNHLNSNAI